jgi:hypothetical protein
VREKMENKEIREKIDSLNPREREVFILYCEDLEYKAIASKLFISLSAVKNIMLAIRRKFEIDQLSRRKTASELSSKFCPVLKEMQNPSNVNAADKKPEAELKPKPLNKENIPAEKEEIHKDKKDGKEKEELNEDVIEKDERKYNEKPLDQKQKKQPKEKKDGNHMKKPDKTKNDRFRILKTIWRLIAIAAIIFSGYMIYDRFFGTSPLQSVSSPEEPGADQEEIAVAVTEEIPTEVIVPTVLPTNTEIVSTQSPTNTPPIMPKPEILFEDDFETGLSNAWEVVSGNPIVVNGTLSADRDTWLLVGDSTWTNYSVEFQGESGKDHFYDGADIVALRFLDLDNMYAYKWVFVEREWYVVKNGEWNIVPQTYSLKQRKVTDFRFEVKGDSIKVYIDGIIESSFFDDKFSQGRIGLFISKDTVIDDFKIKEILE